MTEDRLSEARMRLKEIIVRELDLPRAPASIADNAKLFWEGEDGSGLSLDSIEALTLIVVIEGEFGVRIPEGMDEQERLRIFDSVASLADHVIRNAS